MNEIDTIVETAIRERATDIHLCEGLEPRFRIDNKLVEAKGLPHLPPKTAAEQILAKVPEHQKSKFEESLRNLREIDLSFSSVSQARVRVNIYMCESGMQIALRIVPNKRLTAAEIGMPSPIADICKRKSGLFIVTGASGSGKTSTLAAIIDIINASRNLHILTIEDPVEYLIKSEKSLVSQREVGRDSQSFYSALRSSVRENPDVIMLGEMRDLETTRTAIELSETGHLVFATLHTRTAVSTIDRLIGQFPAAEQPQIRLMISDNLIGILSQVLLAKKSGGLIAAFELLTMTPAVRNLIREQKVTQILNVIQTNRQIGMCTMEDSMLNLVERNVVSPSEAMARAFRPQELLQMMRESPKVPLSEIAGLK